MSISNNKSIFIRGVKIIAFLSLIASIVCCMNYYLYNDNGYSRVMMHELYKAEDESIDLVFAGASVAYRTFDPEIWDEELGLCTFNLGTSNQVPDSTYYLLKEVFRTQKCKYCIYAATWMYFYDLPDLDNPLGDYLVFDNYHFSADKIVYGYDVFNDRSLANAWFPCTRNNNTNLIKTFQDVKAVKDTDNYRNYGYDIYGASKADTSEEYRGRGYVYRGAHYTNGEIGKFRYYYDIDDYNISQDRMEYFDKIVNLCKENDCELILIEPPLPYASMRLYNNYQEAHDFLEKTANDRDITFLDFSFIKPSVIDLPDTYFYDYTHMSGAGASQFSRVAARMFKDIYISKNIDNDLGDLFYTSYEELLDSTPWIYSTWLEVEGSSLNAYSTYGNSVTPEYEFLYSDDNGFTWNVIRDYSIEPTIDIDSFPQITDMVMVKARPVGTSDEYQQQYKQDFKR